MKLLTVNWQLKLVALFLAIALWFYTSGQARVSRTFTVKIPDNAVLGLGDEYRIASVTPREFTVEIDGPSAALRDLRGDVLTPRLEISARALEEGRQSFPITNAVLGLEPDLRIEGINPASVEDIAVAFGRVVTAELIVDLPNLVDVPPGLEPSISLEEGTVTVSGPEVAIQELVQRKRLPFAPVPLSGVDPMLAKPWTMRRALTPIVPPSVQASPVYANVTLKPLDGVKSQISVPVQLLAPPDFLAKHRVELSQQQVVVTVRGPSNLLAALKPEDLIAYVNLRRPLELNQAKEIPVELVAPPWLTAEPAAVRVTLSVAPTVAPSTLEPLPVGP